MASEAQVRKLGLEVGELLADQGPINWERFSEYAGKPVRFLTNVLLEKPWDRQKDIANALTQHRLVSVASANGIGKDWLAARITAYWVLALQGFVLLVGPTERQVRHTLMGELRRCFHKANLPGKLYEQAWKVDPDRTNAGVVAFISNEVSRLTGYHAERVLVVLSEAQGIPDELWEALLANATGAEDRVLALGNPLFESGRFFQTSRADHWHFMRIPASQHPNVKKGRVIIPGGITPEFIDTVHKEYGEGSSAYRSRVLAQFPEGGEETLAHRQWVRRAFERHRTGQMEPKANGQKLIVAVDPARLGTDETVVALRQGPIVRELWVWKKKDTMETTGTILLKLREQGHEPKQCRLVVDSVGVGSGVCDRLREHKLEVVEFNGGMSPRDLTKFANKRSETAWRLRQLLENDDCALPEDEKLLDELAMTRYRIDSSGRVRFEAKDDLRRRLSRSSDRMDAVMMALSRDADAGGVIIAGPVEVGVGPSYWDV